MGSPVRPGCEADGCPNKAAPLPPARGKARWNRWCWTHLWRKREGKPMDAELRKMRQSKTERLVEAAYALIDAAQDGREGVLRAKARLRKAGGV